MLVIKLCLTINNLRIVNNNNNNIALGSTNIFLNSCL